MQKFRVCEIYRAIQGEGSHAGRPCTLVRLQGCNLRCGFCDTAYAQNRRGGTEMELDDLVETIKGVRGRHRNDIILITGGEPTLQPISAIEVALHDETPWQIHLETNGTRPINGGFDWVVISPKRGRDGNIQLCEFAVDAADEVKWLIQDVDDVRALRAFLRERRFNGIVSVQPVSMDERATRTAYRAALTHGWRLSLQLHKLVKGVGDESAIRTVLSK